MHEELGILLLHHVQPMFRPSGGKPVLRLHPLDQTRLEHAPQPVSEVPVPMPAVVLDPATQDGVVSTGQLLGIVGGSPVDPPAPDGPNDFLHRLGGRPWHADPKELPRLATLHYARLEVVAEEGERGLHVMPLKPSPEICQFPVKYRKIAQNPVFLPLFCPPN